MGADDTRITYDTQLEEPTNVNDELINEVEVVTADEREPAASNDILPQSSANATPSLASVATSMPSYYLNQLDLLVREVRSLKERLADLMKRVQERLIQEELLPPAPAVPEPVALEVISTPPAPAITSRNQPSSNSAVKRKSTKSKYAKKRRIVIPGGVTRSPRSLNVKPTTTTVGNVNLAAAAAAYDDDFE